VLLIFISFTGKRLRPCTRCQSSVRGSTATTSRTRYHLSLLVRHQYILSFIQVLKRFEALERKGVLRGGRHADALDLFCLIKTFLPMIKMRVDKHFRARRLV
jgi:acetolactate synthase small subunit